MYQNYKKYVYFAETWAPRERTSVPAPVSALVNRVYL